MLKKTNLIILISLFFILCLVTSCKTVAANSPAIPDNSWVTHKFGRFTMSVPPSLSENIKIYKIYMGPITIQEIIYNDLYHTREEMEYNYSQLRNKEFERYFTMKKRGDGFHTRGGFMEKDVTYFFNKPAKLVCYLSKKGSHDIVVFIATDTCILKLTCWYFYHNEEEVGNKKSLDIALENIAAIYKYYVYGKDTLNKNSFFSEFGRIEDTKSTNEEVHIVFQASPDSLERDINIEVITSMVRKEQENDSENSFSMSEFLSFAQSIGAQAETIRHKKRTVAGYMRAPERIIVYKDDDDDDDDDDYQFNAQWEWPGEFRNPYRPFVSIDMTAPGEIKKEALEIWDMFLENFDSVYSI